MFATFEIRSFQEVPVIKEFCLYNIGNFKEISKKWKSVYFSYCFGFYFLIKLYKIRKYNILVSHHYQLENIV